MKITESKLYRDKCYINGEWISSDSGETISVNNPSTLEEIGTVPKCETAETKRAIEKELEDKRMNEEQQEWENNQTPESENPAPGSLVEEMLNEFDNEPDTNVEKTNSTIEVSTEKIEARPLPTKVRKAQKKQD